MHTLVYLYLRINTVAPVFLPAPRGDFTLLNRGDRVVARFCATVSFFLVTDLVPETDASGMIQGFMQAGDRGDLFSKRLMSALWVEVGRLCVVVYGCIEIVPSRLL
jgi:hypothetical protein